MRARLSALLAFGIITSLLIAGSPTAAADPQGRGTRDAESYATEVGIPVDVAGARLEQQAAAGRLMERLESGGSSWYAGLWIEHQPEFRVIVYSTKTNQPGLATAAEAAGLTAPIDVRPALRTYSELSALVDNLARLRVAKEPMSLKIDVRNNKVVVETPSAQSLRDRATALDVDVSDSVVIDEATYYVVATSVIYAGEGLSACTAGYGVKQSAGTTRGTTTAGHCSNTQRYSGTTLPYVAGASVGGSDVQWHTTAGHTVTNRAIDGIEGGTSPLYRIISSKAYRSGQGLNSYVCAWGISNGYSCGYLTSNAMLPAAGTVTNPTATYMLLERFGVDMSDPGDSGGPVYAGGSAWGMIHGCRSTDPQCDDPALKDQLVYMASNYLEGGIGVSILTTP